MKIYCNTNGCHHKNLIFLKNYLNYNKNQVYNFNEADIIISVAKKYDISKYPTKKFIFGPHFGKERINEIRSLNNIHNNAIYIQPSQPSVDLWLNHFGFKSLPIYAIPFGVDVIKFSPGNTLNRNKVFVYYKNRDPKELSFLTQFLKNNKIQYKLFNYKNTYNESEYMSYLKQCKYGIWLGSHESQGFALEEALSCNVPLLVWNVKLRSQEWSNRLKNQHIKTEVTSIPYWDNRCGEYFYSKNELLSVFDKFINNLDTYKPREYIIENVNMDTCYKKWDKLINSI
jgi:hypothetical protein